MLDYRLFRPADCASSERQASKKSRSLAALVMTILGQIPRGLKPARDDKQRGAVRHPSASLRAGCDAKSCQRIKKLSALTCQKRSYQLSAVSHQPSAKEAISKRSQQLSAVSCRQNEVSGIRYQV